MKNVLSVIFLVFVMVITGCQNAAGINDDDLSAGKDDNKAAESKVPDNGGEDGEIEASEGEKTDDSDIMANNYAKKSMELPIYTINNDMECVQSTALIPNDTKIDASLVISEVTANFAKEIVVDKIEEGTDYVAVYFEKDSAPLKDVSKAMEEAMLDCIAYSLIDNLEYCKKVYYRSSEGIYSSRNITLEYDEAYVTSGS